MGDGRLGNSGDRGPEDRDDAADARDGRADARDEQAGDRDERAGDRDERAGDRDERADDRERDDGPNAGAVADRTGASRDRQGAASDRSEAAGDREAASVDRGRSAEERAADSIDELTGVHRREAGIVELEREIDRARRTKQPFVLAFVDVDSLKARNDSLGHAAGDQLLRATTASIRTHLRGYDLIVRFGGDEFLCALPDVSMAQAADRFSLVHAELASTQQASVTVGFAELQPDDKAEDLIARADEAMYGQRRQRRSPPSP